MLRNHGTIIPEFNKMEQSFHVEPKNGGDEASEIKPHPKPISACDSNEKKK